MLSRAQEARVRDVLANHRPGTIQTYCLEHLAAAVKIPPGHLADLAAFVRSLREHGACQTRYGGICDADPHEMRNLILEPEGKAQAKRLESRMQALMKKHGALPDRMPRWRYLNGQITSRITEKRSKRSSKPALRKT